MATTTVTVNGFVRAPGTPVTDGNIAVFDTVTGELIADGGKNIAELTVDKSTGGNGAADAGKVLEFQANGGIRTTADYGVSGSTAFRSSIDGVGIAISAEADQGTAIEAISYGLEPTITVNNGTGPAARFATFEGETLTITNEYSALEWSAEGGRKQTRVNMLPALGGNAAKVLAVNVAEDDVEWVAASGGGGGAPAGDGIVSVTGGVFDTPSTLGDRINASTAKTTPVDADMIGLMDSAASNVLKKLSWANIKATLKTYFDTLYSPTALTIRTYSGTTDALVIGDAGNMVRGNNAAGNVITVPLNATVAFPVGSQVLVSQYGAGQTSFTPEGGVTINSGGAALKIAIRYGCAVLTKTGVNEWNLEGNLAI